MAEISLGSNLSFQEVKAFFDQVSAISGEKEIIVDMQSCKYLNSLMLSGLIRARKVCQSKNCQIVLRNVSAPAMTLLETTNVLSLFKMDTVKENTGANEDLALSYSKLPGNNGLFTLSGSLNCADHCSSFRDFYEQYILEIRNAVLDCLNLEHLGSTGVTEMFRLRGIFEEKSGQVIIISQTDSVESIWKMMHLVSLIPKVNNLQEAELLLSR